MAFEYIQLGESRFISLRQNPLHFLWLLIWKRALLPKVPGKRALVELIKARFVPKHGKQVLLLPVNGTWCRPVRGGVKVFDMGRKSVIKVYDQGTDKDLIRGEVALFSKIGQNDFAPALKNWNIDEGWYEEQFIEGLSGYGLVPKGPSEIVMDRYFSLIEPLLETIIVGGFPEPVSALSYLAALEESLKTSGNSTKDEVLSEARALMNQTLSRCRNLIGGKNLEIYLTFCHGDFHQRNMFWTGSVVRLIDWEAAQRLTLLFDFFNFFFSQLYLGNTSLECPKEVKKGVERMASRLSVKAPQLAGNIIECAELYRLVYYIERIDTFLGSFGLDSQRISRWIRVFREFEEKRDGERNSVRRYADAGREARPS